MTRFSRAALLFGLLLACRIRVQAEEDSPAPFETLAQKAGWFRQLIASDDPEARLGAAIWLAEHGDGKGEPVLLEALSRAKTEREEFDLVGIRRCLGALRCRTIVPDLIADLAASPSIPTVEVLAAIGDEESRSALARLARGDFPMAPVLKLTPLEASFEGYPPPLHDALRLRAALALVAAGEPSFAPQVEAALVCGSDGEVREVVSFLARLDPPGKSAVAWYMRWEALRIAPLACFRARLCLDLPGRESQLQQALARGNPEESLAVASLFAESGNSDAREFCLAQLDSESPQRRALAAFTLGRIGTPSDASRLVDLLGDERTVGQHSTSIREIALHALAQHEAEAAVAIRGFLSQSDDAQRKDAADLARLCPGHGASRELLTAAVATEDPSTRSGLISACEDEAPEQLVDCIPLLDRLLREDQQQDREIARVLARTGAIAATRSLVRCLGEGGEHQNHILAALGKLGHPEGIAAIEAYAGDEEDRDQALHQAAPETHPPSVRRLCGQARDHAKVWDYAGMMAVYERLAESLARRWGGTPAMQVPENCAIRAVCDHPRNLLTECGVAEVVKQGRSIDVIWKERKLGVLDEAEFARVWRVAAVLRQSIEACALRQVPDGRWGDEWSPHVVLHLDIAPQTGGDENSWTWRESYNGLWGEGGTVRGLAAALWELLDGQRVRCTQKATEEQAKVLRARGSARDRYLRRCRLDWTAVPPPLGSEVEPDGIRLVPFEEGEADPGPAPFGSVSDRLGAARPWRRLVALQSLEKIEGADAAASLNAGEHDTFFLVREAAGWLKLDRACRTAKEGALDGSLACVLAGSGWTVREAAARTWEQEGEGRVRRLLALLDAPEADLRMLGMSLCTPEDRNALADKLETLAEHDPFTVVARNSITSRGASSYALLQPVGVTASRLLGRRR